MSRALIITGVVAAAGFGALVVWYARRRDLIAVRNDAAGPRLPGMPEMPRMPAMLGGGAGSAAVPNAPTQTVPQVPPGLFTGMWG